MKFLDSNLRLFDYYKSLGEKAMAQLPDDALFYRRNEESNSIAIIVQHLWGNMLSRWTAFLTEDGEKDWRDRDSEFEESIRTREQLIDRWNAGWACLFDALSPLQEADLERTVYIRNEGHSVMDAISRQVAHYAYHVGQIVLLAKEQKAGKWDSLSIPRNTSASYNAGKFSQEKGDRHFTENS